jgi:hypothetical protein
MNASPVTTQNFNIVSFQKIFLFFFNPYIGVSILLAHLHFLMGKSSLMEQIRHGAGVIDQRR